MWLEAVRSLVRSIGRDGVRTALHLVRARWSDRDFDRKYGTETYSWEGSQRLGVAADRMIDAEPYKPSHAGSLRALLGGLGVGPGDVLLDVGSGKGRVLMVAAELGIGQARGVEISPRLTAVAERNLACFGKNRPHQTAFELVCSDIRDYRLRDDESLVYLFNPFGAGLTAHVANLVRDSLQRRPRSLHVIYRAPDHAASSFDRCEELAGGLELRIDGQDYLVFRSRAGAAPGGI